MADRTLHAAVYDAAARLADAAGLGERRARLLSEARGRVLEVGAGTGRNLAHYRDVDGVCLLEPDPSLRSRLDRRRHAAAVPSEVLPASVEEAHLDHQSFDTVVCALVLCTVEDPGRALEAIRRLLRPDGRLLFLEHVRAVGLTGGMQRLAGPAWRRVSGGCHLDRRTTVAIREAGFVITDCERFHLSPIGALCPALVAGVARPSARAAAITAGATPAGQAGAVPTQAVGA